MNKFGTFRHHITTSSLFHRLGLLDIDSYFYNRFLRWAGYVARMPMSRAPRQLLASWVAHSRTRTRTHTNPNGTEANAAGRSVRACDAHSRPAGCPQMTWGRSLENALKREGISKEFDEWFAIAKDRSKWRQLTHSNPRIPNLLMPDG